MTPDRPDRPRTAAAALLQELIDDTLDPGYRAAARRRSAAGGTGEREPWYGRPAVALGCLLIGFVLVVAYVHTNRSAPEAQRVHDGLVDRVRAAQGNVNALGEQVDAAQRRLAAAQARALPSSGPLARSLEREQDAAGALAVHGPGVEVTLREPPAPTSTDAVGRAGSTPITATNILTDRDIRSVVNELWRDGAEAIAVNGIRLTATSAIRFAGEAVLVDFEPITSPYTVQAIGNADELSTRFAQSAVASRYQTLVSADGIGFAFSDEDSLSLPAGTQVDPRYASPPPSSPSATTPRPSSSPSMRRSGR